MDPVPLIVQSEATMEGAATARIELLALTSIAAGYWATSGAQICERGGAGGRSRTPPLVRLGDTMMVASETW
jgi:hypothetical protein